MMEHAVWATSVSNAADAGAAMTPVWLLLIVFLLGGLMGVAVGTLAGRVLLSPRALPMRARAGTVAATAVLVGLMAWLFGISSELPAFTVFAAVAVVLGTVDVIEKRLPNAVLYPALAAVLVLLAGASLATGDWASLLGALAGGVGLFVLYFVLAVISPAGIGMGDVKLAALIGLVLGYLGWMPILVGATAAFFIGGLTSLIALLSGRATLKTSLPFGPAMLAGAFVGMLLA